MSKDLIVLTGAAGNLGSTVHRALLAAGKNVRATDRARAISASQPLVWADLMDTADCRRISGAARILVHLAFNRRPEEYMQGYTERSFDDHIQMNRRIFLAAGEAGIKKIIYSSSIQVVVRQLPRVSAHQPPRSLPLNENSTPEPDNWYSLAKLCSEQMLGMLRRQFGIDYVILRYPLLVHAVPFAHPELYQGRLGEAFSYLTMRDAADLVLKVIDADLPGAHIYLPASRNNTQGLPVQELLRKYFAGVALRKPAAEIEGLVDLSTLSRDLGWEPMDLSQPEAEQPRPNLRDRFLKWIRTTPLYSVPMS